MRQFLASAGVVCLALGASQAAAAGRLTDAAYLKASRCGGLAQARGLDVAALDATLKAQKRGRDTHIVDAARAARRNAQRETGPRAEADLAACMDYVPAASELTPRAGGAPG